VTGDAGCELTVVIVNYNGGADLVSNLHAWWSEQDGRPWQVIVVDNHSSDGSPEAVADRFPGIRMICNTSNPGFAVACNQALREARGEFVLLLNPDVTVMHDALDLAVAYMRDTPDAGIVGAKIILPDGRIDGAAHRMFKTPMTYVYKMSGLARLFPRSARFGNYYRRDLDSAVEPADVDSVTGAFLMIRATTLASIGPLDERFFMYCEDEDWCWRVKHAGMRVVYHPGVVAHHRKGSSSRKRRVKTTLEWHRSLIRYHRKNMAARYAAPVNWLVYGGIGAVLALRLPVAALRQLAGR
jgi:GT2 family glycosyltransferase